MKNLICINTYKGLFLVKAFIWDYILFVKDNENYDFILSLDGIDTKTIQYCKKYHIPLVYSEMNEGVGISKNRIIKSFPHYDNYFFIEDDVELLDSNVFEIHVYLSQQLNIHHFSLHDRTRILEKKDELIFENYHIIQAMYGSAQMNFFTKKGLDTVGGFHSEFAKYKRFGHTEHTYRFYHVGLSQYPFQIIEECIEGYFRWNNPKTRVRQNFPITDKRLFVGEEALIQKKICYFPLKTLSDYYFLNKENVNKVSNIDIDAKLKLYKKIYYLKQKSKTNLKTYRNYIRSMYKNSSIKFKMFFNRSK